jgi:hypothetical protein
MLDQSVCSDWCILGSWWLKDKKILGGDSFFVEISCFSSMSEYVTNSLKVLTLDKLLSISLSHEEPRTLSYYGYTSVTTSAIEYFQLQGSIA